MIELSRGSGLVSGTERRVKLKWSLTASVRAVASDPFRKKQNGLNPNTNNAYVKGEAAAQEDIYEEVSDASDSD